MIPGRDVLDLDAPRACAHCDAPIPGGSLVYVVRVRVGRDLLVCSRQCQRRAS